MTGTGTVGWCNWKGEVVVGLSRHDRLASCCAPRAIVRGGFKFVSQNLTFIQFQGLLCLVFVSSLVFMFLLIIKGNDL